MKAIILGAGRGMRLMPYTLTVPKCLLSISSGRCILDWTLQSLENADIREIVFVGGYRIAQVRSAYPHLRFIENQDWAATSTMHSLMCASKEMDQPVVVTYSDIIFEPGLIDRLISSQRHVALAVDLTWRSRYTGDPLNPPELAEKVRITNGIVQEIGKNIRVEAADAESLGLAYFSDTAACKAASLLSMRSEGGGSKTGSADSQQPSTCLSDLLQWMVTGGEAVHTVETQEPWHELDTPEDLERAKSHLA
jgi:choline kinase